MVRLVVAMSLVLTVLIAMSLARPASAQFTDPCVSYTTYVAAEDAFLLAGGPDLDPAMMDGDGDGFPCEHLSGAPASAATAAEGLFPRGGNTGGDIPGPSLPVNGVSEAPSASAPASAAASDVSSPEASASPAASESAGASASPIPDGPGGGPGGGPGTGELPGEIAPDAVSVYVRVAGDVDLAGDFVYGAEAPAIGRPAVAGDVMVATVDLMTGIVIDSGVTDGDGVVTLDGESDAPFYIFAYGDDGCSAEYMLPAIGSLALHVTSFVVDERLPVGGVEEPPTGPVATPPVQPGPGGSGSAPGTGEPVVPDPPIGGNPGGQPVNDRQTPGDSLGGTTMAPAPVAVVLGVAEDPLGNVMNLPTVGTGSSRDGTAPMLGWLIGALAAAATGAMATGVAWRVGRRI